MNGPDTNGTDARGERAQKDVLEELFRHASARERPPADAEQGIHDTLHAQWKGMTVRRRRRRVIISLAAAASLVLAVFLGSGLLQGPPAPVPAIQVATIEKVLGSAFIHFSGDGGFARAEESLPVETGQQIVTGLDSRIALRWRDGTSLRADQNSELRLKPAGEIELVKGRLYLDTQGADLSIDPPVILTPAGPVRHLGTQYMASVTSRLTSISVREGRVALGAAGSETIAVSGERLNIDASGAYRRQAISSFGEPWEWAQDLAPAFDSNGRSMSDFLDWVGRETGRSIAFETPRAEQLAAVTMLSGNVDLEPMRALTVVLQTTDLVSEAGSGTITVSLRK